MPGNNLAGREPAPCSVSQQKVPSSHLPPQVSRFCRSTRWTGHEQRGVPSPLATQMWEQPPLSRAQGWAAVERKEGGGWTPPPVSDFSLEEGGGEGQARPHNNWHSHRGAVNPLTSFPGQPGESVSVDAAFCQ